MTRFDEPPSYLDQYQSEYEQSQRTTSGWAISSLVCSLIICCPFVTVLGPIFGLVAIASINRNPATRKGTGLALAGIVIGLIVTILWVTVSFWSWNNLVRPQMEGPREAFTEGFAGNPAGFRAHFFGDAAGATDEEIEAFIAELRSRYGEFVTITQDEAALQADPPTMEDMFDPIREHPYLIEFTDETVSATIEFAPQDPDTMEFFWGVRFGRIVIHDPERGDIVFPPDQP